ncbi:hypothetical protein BJ508DRAFT_411961 [Ascobolus immersus RN42]|uniref:Uncharacterized protein n=1 Tax=Ascobolus immersus RN42 TaxID=1160509 RepID=A0A3N4IHE1_ASCIM|nr:hypothetical protein BJ508DRAFT_411961 [Ascobolus immersus RN42]
MEIPNTASSLNERHVSLLFDKSTISFFYGPGYTIFYILVCLASIFRLSHLSRPISHHLLPFLRHRYPNLFLAEPAEEDTAAPISPSGSGYSIFRQIPTIQFEIIIVAAHATYALADAFVSIFKLYNNSDNLTVLHVGHLANLEAALRMVFWFERFVFLLPVWNWIGGSIVFYYHLTIYFGLMILSFNFIERLFDFPTSLSMIEGLDPLLEGRVYYLERLEIPALSVLWSISGLCGPLPVLLMVVGLVHLAIKWDVGKAFLVFCSGFAYCGFGGIMATILVWPVVYSWGLVGWEVVKWVIGMGEGFPVAIGSWGVEWDWYQVMAVLAGAVVLGWRAMGCLKRNMIWSSVYGGMEKLPMVKEK